MNNPLPLSLYVHLPWCVRKCPYCDFNSHEMKDNLPEQLYVAALLQELDTHVDLLQKRPLISIFFGGGTPSLFSAQAIAQILDGVAARMPLAENIEITLEANPGTAEQTRFRDFHLAGINRLSLGIQSLQNDKLKILGRIHDKENAMRAIEMAQTAGFTNFNLDLMYGLPQQSLEDAMHDLETAISFHPTHLSWYQLTIEPNTFFYHHTPALPSDEAAWQMQLSGQQLLQAHGLQQYEVSAYSLPQKECAHNNNYWTFGDYLGIGAGAHSKISLHERDPHSDHHHVIRFMQVKHPRDYLDAQKRKNIAIPHLNESDLIFEFMLNALRLTRGVSIKLFTERTGVTLLQAQPLLQKAIKRGLLIDDKNIICATDLGKRFLNDLVGIFLVTYATRHGIHTQ